MSSSVQRILYHALGDCKIYRSVVSADKKSWEIPWPQYSPTPFSFDFKSKPWADLDVGDPNFKPKWNQIDGKVNRRSFEGLYKIVDGYPLNPRGRTGIRERGKLGRWGPNHAADPIVTRWKRDVRGDIIKHSITNLAILQFVAIQRRDTGDWAIPGGMVDAGENVSATVKREFFEEALNGLEMEESERAKLEKSLEKFFNEGVEVYRGYVDDPRNTDNAWMETTAYNFHDENGNIVGKFELRAGDDAGDVKWTDIDHQLKLYASHSQFIENVAKKLGAHW